MVRGLNCDNLRVECRCARLALPGVIHDLAVDAFDRGFADEFPNFCSKLTIFGAWGHDIIALP